MDVQVDFPHDAAVQARSKSLVVEVGPPPDKGGDPDAYGPFDMLLCGLGCCTGYMVLDFLKERGLPTDAAGLRISAERSRETHLLETVTIEIRVPAEFPAKYEEAIIRAAKGCPVKDQLGVVAEFRVVVG
jgi:putative redox protein